MKILFQSYGKTILYIFAAAIIIIPLIFLLLHNQIAGLNTDLSTDLKNDNAYLQKYQAPVIKTSVDVIKLNNDTSGQIVDLKALYNVSATVNGEVFDYSKINIETDLDITACGYYEITFKATQNYTDANGCLVPKTGYKVVKLIVE